MILGPVTPSPVQRVDKWLWAIRLYKTRSMATAACRAGSVTVNDCPAKPAREVRAGEIVKVRQGLACRTLEVVDIPRSRVGAGQVCLYCQDRTPPGESERARNERVQQFLSREKGSGRPTKRDRRLLERLLDGSP